MNEPKYDIDVNLIGQNGNAFVILGLVSKALRRAGASPAEIEEFQKEAMASDYDHLLRTAMAWVNVC